MRRGRDGAGITARVSVLAIASVTLLSLLAIVPAGVIASGSQFGPYRVSPVGSEPEAVAIGDVTGDGIADIVLTTGYANAPADFGLLVFAGEADGTLAAPVAYATAGTYPQRPETVDIGDLNGDGRPDVVVGLSGLGIQLFAQAADGTLERAGPRSERRQPQDRDRHVRHVRPAAGRRDRVGDRHRHDLRRHGRGLAAASTYPVQHDGWDDIEAGDVTGDGRTDIVVMSGQGLVPNISVLAALAERDVRRRGRVRRRRQPADARHRRRRRHRRRAQRRRRDLRRQQPDRAPRGLRAVDPGHARGSADRLPELRHPGAVEVSDVDLDGRSDAVVVHEGWLRVGAVPRPRWWPVRRRGPVPGPVLERRQPPRPRRRRRHRGRLAGHRDRGRPARAGDPAQRRRGGTAVADIHADAVAQLLVPAADPRRPRRRRRRPAPTPTPTPAPTPTPTPAPVPPSAPQSLAASPNLAAGVGLTWQPPAAPGTFPGHRVPHLSGDGGATPTSLVTVGNVLAFTDASVANGTTYRYLVAAISAAGEGAGRGGGRRRAGNRPDRSAEPDGDRDQVRHRADLVGTVVDRRHRGHRVPRLPRHDERR